MEANDEIGINPNGQLPAENSKLNEDDSFQTFFQETGVIK